MDIFIAVYPFQSDIVDDALVSADTYNNSDDVLKYSLAILDSDQDIEPAARHFTYVFREGEFGEDVPGDFSRLLEGTGSIDAKVLGCKEDVEDYTDYLDREKDIRLEKVTYPDELRAL